MRYSGIGGQAVIEGVMMKNQDKYAVAVRKPDKEIEVMVSDYTGIMKNQKLKNMPIVRGVLNFVDSMVLGMKTLTYSASFYEDEEDAKKAAKKAEMTPEELAKQEKKDKKKEDVAMGGTVALSIVVQWQSL